jgi:acetolactate decarboxylase
MRRIRPVLLLLGFFLITFSGPAGAEPASSATGPDTLRQYATITSLAAGKFDGNITIATLRSWGNFGLGTFNGLDGEMVVLDGQIYRVAHNGTVSIPDDDVRSPFAQIVAFSPDATFSLENIPDMTSLHRHLGIRIAGEEGRIHAFRVHGTFSSLTLRSVARQSPPFPLLSRAIEGQNTFHLADIDGTLVGFRFPKTCASVGPAVYHFHFISDDRQHGGHVLEAAIHRAEADVDTLRHLRLELP